MAENIEQIVDESIQRDEKKKPNIQIVPWLVNAGLYMPRWWSTARDRKLREFWKGSDHLAGTIYTVQSKMVSIPPRVVARNPSNREHVKDAERWHELLIETPEFGAGWDEFYKKWIEDYVSVDNGSFAEVIGAGSPIGPIDGTPLGIAHLDSGKCQRTGNPIYPVIYIGSNGKKHKLHFSRVMFASQMPSPLANMNGVGFSAVSRSINVAQTLVDILQFKQEKLGSRPHRAILIAQGGLDPEDVAQAFQVAESKMDAQGLSRYSKVVVTGSSSIKDAAIDKVELSSLPDGFDEQSSLILGMATISLAFGMDAKELFPAISSASSKADALLQHMKQRRKGPGEIMGAIQTRINNYYLPPHLELKFDYQDDAQDRQQAEIDKLRADTRLQDGNSRAMSMNVTRARMADKGEISRLQFAEMELGDGRLMDGSSVLTLFYKDDTDVAEYLDLGTDDPLNVRKNDEESMRIMMQERAMQVARALTKANDDEDRILLKQALSALAHLEKYYDTPQSATSALLGTNQYVEGGFVDGRVRSDAPLSPRPPEEGNSGNRERHPEEDGLYG